MNIRHMFYLVIGLFGAIATWSYGFQWIADGGNVFNPVEFFADGIRPGGTAAFLSIDMAVTWAVFLVWVCQDCMKIGLGKKWAAFFVVLTYIGVCFTFPVYLIVRERYLARKETVNRLEPNRA